MRLIYLFFIFSFFCKKSFSQVVTTSVINPPAQLRCNDVPARLNSVVFGAIPPNSQNKPVIVFVHGWFDNGYSWFMSNNKWYENAYNAGYRTAYFFHSFSNAFQDNGKVIAEMIRQTCQHYNTNNVVAMCHSKGGLDMEWALYNENVWDSIAGVITLSSPYYGAPLIDVISNPIVRLITENIPFVGPIFRGRGTYQMQPAYMMGVVRPMMDNSIYNRPEKFHCYGAWGADHRTVLPNAISDDILKIVFPEYNPFCISLPGFGTFAGDLMSAGMVISGNITRLVAVQPRYNNPQRNTYLNDGLVPYYSAIRPGSVVISQSPASQQSYLNHIDELFSWYTWDIVQPEVEYFKDHPVYRTATSASNNETIEQASAYQPVSDLQLIQTNNLKIEDASVSKLYLVGNYKNEKIKVFDENEQFIKTIDLNVEVTSFYSIFHEIDLSSLLPDMKYTLQVSTPITGLFQDGNKASMQLNTKTDKTYYADEALDFEVSLHDWTGNMETVVIKGFLNRNMDENDNMISDKIIPVSFTYNQVSQTFICHDKIILEDGIYNLSVYAENNTIKRFATTSILMKQQRKSIAENDLISAFPNPANDVITIEFNITGDTDYSIEIFDIIGKEVMKKNLSDLNTGTQQIQFSAKESNLAKGSYFISLNVNGERKSSKIITIN